MEKEQIISKLQGYAANLQEGGIQHLHLFGSCARGTAVSGQSDIDLMADFDQSRRYTLFDKAGLEVELTELLGTQVELSDRAMLREHVRVNAERDAILVF